MTVRQVLSLVENLPGGTPAWSQNHELMASVIDAVERLKHVLLLVNTDKKHRSQIGTPFTFPRPGEHSAPQKKAATFKSTRSFDSPLDFDRWRTSRLKRTPIEKR